MTVSKFSVSWESGVDDKTHPSCPDLIRASIHLRKKVLAKKMDHRVKPGDECVLEDVLSERCKSVLGLVATPQSKVTASLRGGVGSNWR